MDFSYAQGSTKYRQLLKNDIVVVFLDAELIMRHVSSNNDILGVPVGAMAKGMPIKKFMPDSAYAKLMAFSANPDGGTVIDYEMILPDKSGMAVRQLVFSANDEFDDGVVIRSYITCSDIADAPRLIAEYGTALRYIWLIDNLSVGFFSHDGAKIVYANKMMGELLGREQRELLGEPMTKFFTGRPQEQIKSLLSSRNRFGVLAVKADGSTFAVNISVQEEGREDGCIATVEDAVSYKTRGQAEDVFHRAFANVSECVMLLDVDKTITWANASTNDITGYSPEDIIGKNISLFYSGEHRPEFYDTLWELGKDIYRGVIWLRTQSRLLPVTAVISGILNELEQVTSFVLTISHAPDSIRVSESEGDAREDKLTGLFNWEYFEECLGREIVEANKNDEKFAVLLLDIDRFKTINEIYGPDVADLLLKQIAERFRKSLPAESVLTRKDDEFAAIIDDPTALDEMNTLAENLLESMNKPFHVSSSEIDIYISIGIVFHGDTTSTLDSMLKSLYRSLSVPKLDWRSCYQIYNSSIHDKEATSLEERLRVAIIKNEFVLYYLPKIDVKTQKLVGLEALVRWQSPDMGLLAPGSFLAMAEDAGFMPALGEIVFNSACMQLQKWRRMGFDLSLAVNISSLQLRDESFGEKFISIMSSYDINPERIELEITEGMAFQERSVVLNSLNTLVAVGVKIAIDDFGLGYSSINMLRKYPISTIKIDKSIVRGVPDDSDSCDIVAAMIAMAHSLGMRTSAEGVETMAQYEYLINTTCDEMQGFFIGAPTTADDTEELIRSYAAMDSNIL